MGTGIGLAIGGPIGALLGGVAGHVFDRWRDEQLEALAAPAASPAGRADPLDERRVAFATAVIVLAAKLAKADGVVTREEVRKFKTLFDIGDSDAGDVGRIFDEAKRSPEGFEGVAWQVADLFAQDPAVLEQLLGQLFALAAADGTLHRAEIAWLARVAEIFGFDEDAFDAILARYRASRPNGPAAAPADDFAVLGLKRTASDAEIRSVWRRLVREHHPDRLIAQGRPEEMVKQANERLAVINAAYDSIAKERGLT